MYTMSNMETFRADMLNWISVNENVIKYKDESIIKLFIEYIKTYTITNVEVVEKPSADTKDLYTVNTDICIAKISQGAQCSRKHKKGNVYCGTHIKRQPAGVVDDNVKSTNVKLTKKIDIWVQLIKGINYYIDENNNVYDPEHILSLKQNPDVIYKWKLNDKSEDEIIELDN